MTQKSLKIHTENILPIIKKWLYSDKDIFLRELVSNACDAMSKLKVLREHKEVDFKDEELRIDIVLDVDAKTLKVIDTGLGMSADEVEKYIAQVAFSGAEEFVSKYKTEDEGIIGHFGLGFYSAYMVSEKVEINTLSYKEAEEAVFWSCDGTVNYTIDKGSKETRGTEIILYINDADFLESDKIEKILRHYCSFLPFPIYFNEQKINDKDPLWLKNASQCTDQEYLEFYRSLYPMEQDPLFWIHLNVDYPFNLKGILYFPKISKRFDWTQSQIKLFCNRVFVSDNCKEIVPDFLMILKGALDSPDIPLNVSRSYLQMDKTVRQLSTHISKKITDRLLSLYSLEKEKFIAAWPDIETIVKLGCLQDEKFYEKAKDFLLWKNLKGEYALLDTSKEKIFYTVDDKAPFLSLYTEKNIDVILATSPVDSALINFLEGKLENVSFQRVDGAIDDAILDKDKENTLLDADGRTESSKIADYIKSALEIDVEAKSLASASIPALLVVDENMRRMREYLSMTQQHLPAGFTGKNTFVVNTNNKLINSIYGLKDKNPELAKQMITHVYELSLLSQKELSPDALTSFINRSTHILESLSQ